jgi:uncharacterized membrane protein
MAARGRLQAVDVYRGLALIAMAAYHTCWDLNYYGLISVGIGVDPVWITLQRTILTAFLLLTGAGLTLAHGDAIRWRPFWRREAILVAAALAVSVATWFLFQDALAWFGVLHLIAVSALLALPLVTAPLWIGILVAVVVLFLPAVYSSDLFDPRWLDWLGFFPVTPETADLVPLFPWYGVVLVGMLGMRLLRATPAFTWSNASRPVRALAFLGRWSLLFYLLHQPILFGIITPIANYEAAQQQQQVASFLQSCEANCGSKNDAAFCTRYCQCALDETVTGNLWTATADQLAPVVKLCTEMSK